MLEKRLEATQKNLTIRTCHKIDQGAAGQMGKVSIQHRTQGLIGALNDVIGTQGQITHRCLMIELSVAIPGILQLTLGVAQFFVLQLQLNLMSAG